MVCKGLHRRKQYGPLTSQVLDSGAKAGSQMARVDPAALTRFLWPLKRVHLSIQTQRAPFTIVWATTQPLLASDTRHKIWQKPMTCGLLL